MSLFNTMVLKATQGGEPFKYLGVTAEGYLKYNMDALLSPNAKFAVEYAHGGLVHIRSCLTNKYWIRQSAEWNWIVAKGEEPIVDTTSWNCTLFRIDMDAANKNAKFYHVQSGRTVRIPNNYFSIHPTFATEAVSLAIDYDSFVVLPKIVAFKGSNGLYLGNGRRDNFFETRFCEKDIGNKNVAYEIQYSNDGLIRVRLTNTQGAPQFLSNYGSSGKYRIDKHDDKAAGNSQWFSVVKVDKSKVALRSLDNNKICQRDVSMPIQGFKDRLVATADGLVADAHLEVVEPLISRSVTVQEFDLDKARIYDVQLLYSAESRFDNYSDDQIQSGTVNGTISTTNSKTYSNSINVSCTVETTFTTGVPLIVKGEIKISATAGYTHQWSTTEEDTQSVGSQFTVVVVPRKRTIARGVATKAKCDVPFTYVQKDYPTNGDPPIVTRLSDGIFTGANAYSFQTEVRYEDLPAYTGPHRQAPTGVIESIVPSTIE